MVLGARPAGPGAPEPALEPDVPIVDAHHHLYDRISSEVAALAGGRRRYLIEELLADMDGGHRFIGTVFADADAMYRADGPAEVRSVGETEFANGVAAMSASGLYGPCRIAAGIVSRADLRLGDRVKPVLEAHVAAGNGRFRGIRQTAAWDADATLLGGMFGVGEGLYRDPTFRTGFAHLARMGLTFDAFVMAPQLADVADLARAFPDTRIVLDHAGQPVGIGSYRDRGDEMLAIWKRGIIELARCENVVVKLGGLGSFLSGFPSFRADPPARSERLAAEWRPYLAAAIELFGAKRCMFESNYPVDSGAGAYGTIWNAFKRITTGCSANEKRLLFAGTATHTYRLDLSATEKGVPS